MLRHGVVQGATRVYDSRLSIVGLRVRDHPEIPIMIFLSFHNVYKKANRAGREQIAGSYHAYHLFINLLLSRYQTRTRHIPTTMANLMDMSSVEDALSSISTTSSSTTASETENLPPTRVLLWNIHGETRRPGTNVRNLLVPRVVQVVNPDILLLQETKTD